MRSSVRGLRIRSKHHGFELVARLDRTVLPTDMLIVEGSLRGAYRSVQVG